MTARKLTTKAIAESATTYVGRAGELFYDTATASLKLSDGATAGGQSFVGGAASWPVTNTNGNTGTVNIAIGRYAGLTNQGGNSIALGVHAGEINQGAYSVAIGVAAGWGQTNAQAANTIILNATSSEVDGVASQTNSFYVAPIRTDATPSNILYYNTTTKEVTYGNGVALGYVSSSFGVTSTSAGATTSDGKLYFGLLPFISSTQSGVTISAPLGNINGVWTITVYVGGSATSSRTANPSIGSGTVNASSTRLANIGDYAVMIFQDLTNNHLYQVTTAISAISLNASSGTTVIQQLV